MCQIEHCILGMSVGTCKWLRVSHVTYKQNQTTCSTEYINITCRQRSISISDSSIIHNTIHRLTKHSVRSASVLASAIQSVATQLTVLQSMWGPTQRLASSSPTNPKSNFSFLWHLAPLGLARVVCISESGPGASTLDERTPFKNWPGSVLLYDAVRSRMV